MGKQEVLAIDLGASQIKVFSGTVMDGSEHVLVTGMGSVAADGFVKGAVTDCNCVAKSVRQAVECVSAQIDVASAAVYLGIGGMGIQSHAANGSIALTAAGIVQSDDLDRVCRAAVLTVLPEDLEVVHVLPKSYKLDGQVCDGVPLGKRGQHLVAEIVVVTIPKQTLHPLVAAIAAEGITITRVVANAVAAGQVLAGNISCPCAVLDIGADNTDIVLYDQCGQINHIAALPFGGNYVTSDIMQGLGIDYIHAECVKRYFSKLDKQLYGKDIVLDLSDSGTASQHVPYDFLYNIIESRIDEITAIVCDYLRPIVAEMQVETIHITGGCSMMRSFLECVERMMQLDVRPAVPANLSAEYSSPLHTACYGVLALAAARQFEMQKTATRPTVSLWARLKQLF